MEGTAAAMEGRVWSWLGTNPAVGPKFLGCSTDKALGSPSSLPGALRPEGAGECLATDVGEDWEILAPPATPFLSSSMSPVLSHSLPCFPQLRTVVTFSWGVSKMSPGGRAVPCGG